MNSVFIQGLVIAHNEAGMRIESAGGSINVIYSSELYGRTNEVETLSTVNIHGQLRLDLPGGYIIADDIQRVAL